MEHLHRATKGYKFLYNYAKGVEQQRSVELKCIYIMMHVHI